MPMLSLLVLVVLGLLGREHHSLRLEASLALLI